MTTRRTLEFPKPAKALLGSTARVSTAAPTASMAAVKSENAACSRRSSITSTRRPRCCSRRLHSSSRRPDRRRPAEAARIAADEAIVSSSSDVVQRAERPQEQQLMTTSFVGELLADRSCTMRPVNLAPTSGSATVRMNTACSGLELMILALEEDGRDSGCRQREHHVLLKLRNISSTSEKSGFSMRSSMRSGVIPSARPTASVSKSPLLARTSTAARPGPCASRSGSERPRAPCRAPRLAKP